MNHQANYVAQALISLSKPELGDFISNLKLQKLLYYCQGFHLALYERPFFTEKIIKWQYGPVVPEVYSLYKDFGREAIPLDPNFKNNLLNQTEIELIEEVYQVYGQYSALKLMDMTHREQPWLAVDMSEEISLDSMKTFFKNYLVSDEKEKN